MAPARANRYAPVFIATACILPTGSTPSIARGAPLHGSMQPWASDTFSPHPENLDDPDRAIGTACGAGIDGSLNVVARELAESLARTGELPDAQEIEWRQRKAGNPQVWARTWGARVSGSLDHKSLASDVTKWLGTMGARARCGVATYRMGPSTPGGAPEEAVAVIAVDPVAELGALPTHARVGAWLDLDAVLLRGGSHGRVVVLPPRGAPRTLLSTTTGSTPPHVRARFAVGTPGRHVIQVLADDGAGPRPVLEAEVYAGIAPPLTPPSGEVPGEGAGDGAEEPGAALLARLNGARAAEGIPPVLADATLAHLARAHALAMMHARLLGHDVGDGDPGARVSASGASWKVLGENVAKARTERSAHRALYASPSHRANMLDTRFRRVGIAAVVDPRTQDLWVAQLFAG